MSRVRPVKRYIGSSVHLKATLDAAPWRLRDILIVAGVAILVGIIGASVAAAAIGDTDDDVVEVTAGLATTLAFDAVLWLLAIRFSIRKYRCSWGSLGFRRPLWGDWWLPLATLAVLWIVLGVYVAIVNGLGVSALEPKSTIDEDVFDTRSVVALAGIVALLAAPLAEETFFRGFLFAGLRRRLGLLAAALVSGTLFGLAHADPGSIIPFSLIGAILALAYAVSGSLWVTIATHFLFNMVSFVAALATNGGGN